jgi:hypothetical protein
MFRMQDAAMGLMPQAQLGQQFCFNYTYAQDATIPSTPDFSARAGQWDIDGIAPGKGNTIICNMQKEAAGGSLFVDILMMSAVSDGFTIIDAYITKTALPEGSGS